jgi:hypothetical protein
VTRIKILVTGDMEHLALAASLERYFPSAHLLRPQKLNGVTSSRLRPLPGPGVDARVPRSMEKLVAATLSAITKGDDPAGPADFAFAIDDLELVNWDQPDVVAAWIRRAMQKEIETRYSTAKHQDRIAKEVRQKCAFHLLTPMAEAYFFGDRAALHRAGVKEPVSPRLLSADVERFKTDDPSYLQDVVTREDERRKAREDARRKAREDARRGASEVESCRWEQHPKRYLEHLCKRSGGFYEETRGGAKALRALDWSAVAADMNHVGFARALFQDIADALDVPNPLGDGGCHSSTYPSWTVSRAQLTLRNL